MDSPSCVVEKKMEDGTCPHYNDQWQWCQKQVFGSRFVCTVHGTALAAVLSWTKAPSKAVKKKVRGACGNWMWLHFSKQHTEILELKLPLFPPLYKQPSTLAHSKPIYPKLGWIWEQHNLTAGSNSISSKSLSIFSHFYRDNVACHILFW